MDEPTGKYLGRTFGNYRLQKLIGEGGFSEVYLGEHQFLETPAAIKVLNTKLTRAEFEQFRQEAQTINALHHPGIVRLFDFGVAADIPYMAMSYAPKGSLRELYPAGSRVPLPVVVSLVKQIAAALHYAHQQHVIHRDVKPENMLIGPDGELLLSDFGIAVVQHTTHSLRTQQLVGTAAYMAPEQLRKKPQAASDQYALGVVVYEWLCGELPFEGSPIEIALQHLNEPPPSLQSKAPTLPAAVEAVVLRALAKDPKQRFANMQAFAEALAEAAEVHPTNRTTSAAPMPHAAVSLDAPGVEYVELPGERPPDGEFWPERRREPLPRSKRARHMALLLLVVLGLGTAGMVGVLYAARHPSRQPPLVAVTATPPLPALTQTPLLPLGAGPGDWLEPGYDAQNTNDNSSEHILSAQNVAGLRLLWQTRLPYGPAVIYNIGFAVAHGVIYFSIGDSLVAMSTQTGQVLEKIPLPSGYVSTPAVAGDQLFLTSWNEEDNLLALNLRTGAAVRIGSFRATVSGLDVPAPVAANGSVYGVALLQAVYAVDTQTDRFLWQTPLADVTTTPAVADGVVYVGGSHHLYALNAHTGALLWQSQPQSSPKTGIGFYPPVVGPRYVYATDDQQVLAYPRDCATPCAPAWSFQAPYVFRSSPAFADGLVYAATGDWGTSDNLYALDGSSGHVRWSAANNTAVVTTPVIANGVLYFTDFYTSLAAYAADGCGASVCQPIWSSSALNTGNDGGAIGRVAGGRYYALAPSGKVVAFGLPGT
jgi:outer membrane protein assembly factor BamB